MTYDFTLENVIDEHNANPRTFRIPSKKEIYELEKGDLVKLIFLLNESAEDGCEAERMWVNITEPNGDDFKGTLDNDPYYLKSIKCEDEISFKTENIATIYGGEFLFDETKFAFVSNKAIENRQVNYACKSEEIDNDEDSGWQLFFGDEEDDYLEDCDNISLLTLEEVLSFEPLLEDIFASEWEQFEYSKKENKFIEVS
jgi:hypothetical protein